MQLTGWDGQIVAWISWMGAVGTGHVMSRFGMGRTTTYHRLAI